jgi:SH3 domain.
MPCLKFLYLHTKICVFAYILFQANDVIFLLRRVNDDWFYGQFGNHQGMFPANFIRVVAPLSTSSISQQRQQAGAQTVTALYPFAAETWDDLELKVSVAWFWNWMV